MYYRYWMHGAHFNVPGHYGIRTKDYKLIFFYGMGLGYSYSEFYPSGNWNFEGNKIQNTEPYWEMYDLQKDPNELNNIYNNPDYAELREKLRGELFNLKKQYDDRDNRYPELYELTKNYSL